MPGFETFIHYDRSWPGCAVIMVSAVGLFDLAELRDLFEISHRELLLSLGTTLGVLIPGVLPGELLAVALSLFWLLAVVSRPHDGVLGRVKGIKGFHNIADFPGATTIPGLILCRFESIRGVFQRGLLQGWCVCNHRCG